MGARLLDALGPIVGDRGGGLHEPVFGGNEREYLAECVDSGFVSSVGNFVTRFEGELARFVGSNNALAVVNGTSALHLALVALGVKPGDEVIVPALSFVATASAVALAGATPHFIDVSYETWGVSPEVLSAHVRDQLVWDGERITNPATGRPVTAVVPMHTLGFPLDGIGLRRVADNYGLILVEDAAEALGSYKEGVHAGLAGHASVFSFNGNKTITTGGGGAVVTQDSELASRLRHLATTAKVAHPYEFDHDDVGFNYRMPNINAALGLAQLEQLPDLIGKQRLLHEKYTGLLDQSDFWQMKHEMPGASSNYWLQAIELNQAYAGERDEILDACLESGVPVRPLWKPLNSLLPYKHSPSAPTPVAESLYSRVICLPSSASLV